MKKLCRIKFYFQLPKISLKYGCGCIKIISLVVDNANGKLATNSMDTQENSKTRAQKFENKIKDFLEKLEFNDVDGARDNFLSFCEREIPPL